MSLYCPHNQNWVSVDPREASLLESTCGRFPMAGRTLQVGFELIEPWITRLVISQNNAPLKTENTCNVLSFMFAFCLVNSEPFIQFSLLYMSDKDQVRTYGETDRHRHLDHSGVGEEARIQSQFDPHQLGLVHREQRLERENRKGIMLD